MTCTPLEQPEHEVIISDYQLDTFEVTVGRFRKFVADYPANRPKPSDGSHALIAASGWDASWDSKLPATSEDLRKLLDCGTEFTWWTSDTGPNENKPIACINWYVAFAFCAWDGGRLPTESEWEYAATGGSENRAFPWGDAKPTPSLASFQCLFDGVAGCDAADYPPVGSVPLGAGKWGQQDLAGGDWEWVLDLSAPYAAGSFTNPANLTTGTERQNRGGNSGDPPGYLRAAGRSPVSPEYSGDNLGVRCARNP